MQRVRGPVRPNRVTGRAQRLGRHLTTEKPTGVWIERAGTVEVGVDLLEREQLDQTGDAGDDDDLPMTKSRRAYRLPV
ncbi:hypothetical protein Kisp01_00050 [Kineosporia sp. NBRC 101677]|nr:hypothetical protein Kisp01_00050 [Kineosporia sp. NBRC 101677]